MHTFGQTPKCMHQLFLTPVQDYFNQASEHKYSPNPMFHSRNVLIVYCIVRKFRCKDKRGVA